MSKNID